MSTFNAWQPAEEAATTHEPDGDGEVEASVGPSAPSRLIGDDLEAQRTQITVKLDSLEAGKFYLKHHTYSMASSASSDKFSRRYSDFSVLNDYLVRIYTFRLLPPLPPKRVAISGRHLSDDNFLDRRARGLSRFATAVINHPILKQDSLVQLFFTQASSSEHIKALAVNRTEDEATTSAVEGKSTNAFAVPDDFDGNFANLKDGIINMVDLYTKICQTYERSVRKVESRAEDFTRLSNLADAVVESEQSCSAVPTEANFTRQKLATTSRQFATQADLMLQHSALSIETSLERLKAHRELYSSFRDLVVRHQKFSPDAVDKLRRNTGNNSKKLETVRTDQKPSWEREEAKLIALIDADNEQIEHLLRRRLFIRLFTSFAEVSDEFRALFMAGNAAHLFREHAAFRHFNAFRIRRTVFHGPKSAGVCSVRASFAQFFRQCIG